MRADAQKRGERGFRYPRPRSFPSEADAQQAREEGRPVVMRFKMPERDFVIKDEILGDVEVAASELSDFVIVKADGWPTYHFAVVIDDEDMRITHVLRGQEHLLNTANHLALQEAFGCRTPVYAHLPIILTMKGAKMSKREKDQAVREAVRAAQLDDGKLMELAGIDGAEAFAAWKTTKASLDSAAVQRLARALTVTLPEVDIHDFRVSGYLPEVLVNFIALLGWSAGDDREKYTLDELCQAFSLERVGKKSARFDREKLVAFNTTELAAADVDRKLAAFRDYLSVNEPGPLTGLDDATLTRLIEMCPGLRTLSDIPYKCAVLFVPDDAVSYDEKAVRKWLLKGDDLGLKVLNDLREPLAALAEWSPARLDEVIRGYAEQRALGFGKVAQPLRVAVTGTTVSPQIFDTLAILGQQRTLTRIARVLAHVAAG